MTLHNGKQKRRKKSKVVQNKKEIKSSVKSPHLSPTPSSSSSSKTTSSSTSTSVDNRESIKSKKDFEKILYAYDSSDVSTDDEEEGEEEEESIGGLFFADMTDFLENFKDVPDIPSGTSTMTVPVTDKKKKQKVQGADMGRFVDPLTGVELHSSSTSSVGKDDSKDLLKTESSIIESDFDDLIVYEDDITYEDDVTGTSFDDTEKIDEGSEDLLEKLFQVNVHKVEEVSDVIDWEATLKEYQAKKIRQETDGFINELIHKVVEMAESSTPADVLRRKLDKKKLMLEISQTYSKFKAEKQYSELLQRKITIFFYRQQTYNFIKPDDYKTLPVRLKKYEAVLQNLDKQLAREKALKEAFQAKKNALLDELKEFEAKANHQAYLFEDLVRRTFSKNRPEHVSYFIILHIRSMDSYRRAISKTRLKIIVQQHRNAKLKMQLHKIEHLGNGLTVKNYEHIRHQNRELQKKLEERNNDLSRLYLRLHRSNHILAHYKEKQHVMREAIEQSFTDLQKLLEEQQLLRRRMNELKLTRNRIHKEINHLNMKGGLVNKPLLMYDYDRTVEGLNEKRDTVVRLRATMVTIESRIRRLEKRFTGDNITSLFNRLSNAM